MICEHCDCDGSVRCCLCGQEKPEEDEHYGWTVGGVWMHCQQAGLRLGGAVCVRGSHYDSTTEGRSILTIDPRVHDPIDGEPCEVVK